MSEKQKSIFEELKKIRLEKKKTLKQISQSTRIHLKYLESLEKGNLLEIPEIYDKLFFKSYLKFLEVPEADYYDQFLEYRKTKRDDRTAILDMTQTESAIEGEFNFKNLLYFVPIIIAILVIWFLVSNTLMINDDEAELIEEVSVQDVANKLQSKIDSVKIAKIKIEEDSIIVEKSALMNLNITAIERTWFRIIVDEKDTSEYLLQQGQNVTFTSMKSFDFLIGKANGLKMKLLDSTYGPFGNENQIVKYMRIDSSGVSVKILGYPTNRSKAENENI
jgi:cytoskeleton protein RodZ